MDETMFQTRTRTYILRCKCTPHQWFSEKANKNSAGFDQNNAYRHPPEVEHISNRKPLAIRDADGKR